MHSLWIIKEKFRRRTIYKIKKSCYEERYCYNVISKKFLSNASPKQCPLQFNYRICVIHLKFETIIEKKMKDERPYEYLSENPYIKTL